MSKSTNIDEVLRRFRAVADRIRFDATGEGGQSLARDMASHVGAAISARSLGDQTAPDGSEWPENRGSYGDAKRKQGLPIGVGLKSGKGAHGRAMLSQVECQGEVEVSDEGKKLTIKYGTSEQVRRKAQWFTAGSEGAPGCEPSGATNQPARPFYELDDAIRGELRDMAAEHVRRAIRRG